MQTKYLQVICDIHFETNTLVEVIVGELTKKGYVVERLPILNLPREILDNEKNLKHQPLYKATKNDIVILLGDSMIGAVIKEVNSIDSEKIAIFTDFIQEDFTITRLGFRVIPNVKGLNEKISICVDDTKQGFDSCVYQINKECENFKYRVTVDTKISRLDITIFKEGEIQKDSIKNFIKDFIEKGKEIGNAY